MNDANDQNAAERNEANAPLPSAGMLMFSRDLFFGSKVTGTAAELGLRVELAGDVSEGLAKVSGGGYRGVILDLAMPGLAPADVVHSLPAENRPGVMAFGSHVDTARLEEARQAGCELVLPRSRFSAELPEILVRLAGGDFSTDKNR